MAKRAQTLHGRALAAFTAGLITRREYQDVWLSRAVLTPGRIHFMTRRMVDGRMACSRSLLPKRAAA